MKKFKLSIIFILAFILMLLPSGSFSQRGVPETLGASVGRPIFTLTVTKSGVGNGTVTSDVYGMNCGTVCSIQVPMGTIVTLTATGDSSSVFNGWTGSGCLGTGTCAILINGNKTVDANFIAFPHSDHLIAWYRFTEGSGSTATNFATGGGLGGGLLPNLTVCNTGDFWTYLSGFGSAPRRNTNINGAGKTFAARAFGIASSGWFSYGIFARYISGGSTNAGSSQFLTPDAAGSAWLLEGGSSCGPGCNFDMNIVAVDAQLGTSTLAPVSNDGGGEWRFYFLDNQGRISRVRSNGTIAKGSAMGSWNTFSGAHNTVDFNVGSEDNGTTCTGLAFGCECSFADVIVYNFTTLTDSEWGTIYDQLRSRYGMSARSGW